MVSRQDHTIRDDNGPSHDSTVSGQPDQPSAPGADLPQSPTYASGGPAMSAENLDRLEVTTDNVRRTGAEISDLRGSVQLDPVDPSMLSENVVGHAGLAQALQDFVAYWHDGLGGYAAHLDETGQQLGQAASQYRATDGDAADTLSGLDPGSSHPADEARDRT